MPTLERIDVSLTRSLRAVSAALEDRSPEEILRWAVEMYAPRLAMATAFGPEGCVLLAMLAQIAPKGRSVYAFNLDTGYQFQETLELRQRIQRRYGIYVHSVR